MNSKKFLALVFIIICNTIFSQQSLNNYKYVVVPKKYDFLKSEDQYQLNSLTKFLFKKEGFITLFDVDIKAQELANNPCLSLVSNVKNNSSMFITKIVIELVNCKNEIVYTSAEGKSKQKAYKKAFQEALRSAFQSITSLGYEYNSVKAPVIVEKEVIVEVQKPIDIVKEEVPVIEEKLVEVVHEEVTSVDVVKEEVVEDVPFVIVEKATAANLLYAQTNPLGFQLVDNAPKVVYVLLKSTKKDLYFLKNKNGILYKENNYWFIEYYDSNALVRKNLNIKF